VTYAVVSQQRLSRLETSLGVDISADEPEHEEGKHRAENRPFDDHSFLLYISTCIEESADRCRQRTSVYQNPPSRKHSIVPSTYSTQYLLLRTILQDTGQQSTLLQKSD
jgi:hypothetical protein